MHASGIFAFASLCFCCEINETGRKTALVTLRKRLKFKSSEERLGGMVVSRARHCGDEGLRRCEEAFNISTSFSGNSIYHTIMFHLHFRSACYSYDVCWNSVFMSLHAASILRRLQPHRFSHRSNLNFHMKSEAALGNEIWFMNA